MAAPLATFDLRKVDLTPLEQRKLTFDSHALVTELEASGGFCCGSGAPAGRPGSLTRLGLSLCRSGEAPGGAGGVGAGHHDLGQHGRRLQGHGDQEPPGRRFWSAVSGSVPVRPDGLLSPQEIAVQQIMTHLDSIRKDMVILEKSEFSNLRSENTVPPEPLRPGPSAPEPALTGSVCPCRR